MGKGKSIFSNPFFSGFIGGCALVAMIFMIVVFFFNVNSNRLLIINPQRMNVINNDVNRIRVIQEMERDGILLTPQEYTSNIASYYNTAIAVLVFLFIFFSILSYFHLKSLSEEQVKLQINETLEKLLEDSKQFEEIIKHSIRGLLDDEYATQEYIEELEKRIEGLEKRFVNESEKDESLAKSEVQQIQK